MSKPQIAFIPIARTTFDIPLATEMADIVRKQLASLPVSISGTDELITGLTEAQSAAQTLSADPPDLCLVFQASFADSTMVTSIAKSIDVPLVLWAVPEAHTGGRLRLNSFCGINLAGHALTRIGRPYEHIFAPPDDPGALEKIMVLAQAGRVRNLLQGARLGRVGENPDGFQTCLFDRETIHQQFGLDVVQIPLQEEFFPYVRQIAPEKAAATKQTLAQHVEGLDELDPAATLGTLRVFHALAQISKEQNLDGFAVRCWPEFFTELGCAACGAMSLLSDEMTPCSCEADVNGTITQMILQAISGEAAFGTDIVSINEERDAIVIWHCGLAPLSMADPEGQKGVTIHSNRKLPLLFEFTLKPGPVTIARLSKISGEYRLVIGYGEVIRGPKSFSGTSGLVQFDRPAGEILDVILDEGLEHHISLTYGDHIEVLTAFAEMANLPILKLN